MDNVTLEGVIACAKKAKIEYAIDFDLPRHVVKEDGVLAGLAGALDVHDGKGVRAVVESFAEQFGNAKRGLTEYEVGRFVTEIEKAFGGSKTATKTTAKAKKVSKNPVKGDAEGEGK